jgi:hypothetical protein
MSESIVIRAEPGVAKVARILKRRTERLATSVNRPNEWGEDDASRFSPRLKVKAGDIVRPKFPPAGWDSVKECQVLRVDSYGFVYVNEAPDFGYLDILFEKVDDSFVSLKLNK